jgi:hypothetical protein
MTLLTLAAAAFGLLVVTLAPVDAQLAGGGNAKAAPKGAKGKDGRGKAKSQGGPVGRIGTVTVDQPDFGGPGIWGVPYITNMSNSITAGGKETCESFPGSDPDTQTESCAPFTPLGRQVFAARRKTDSATDPEGHCLPPGVPRMMYTPYPMKMIQEPNMITFIFEGGAHVWRQIPIAAKGFLRHTEDPNPTYLGEAIGWWEGDTLVVDTIGLNDRTWLDFAGHPHGEKLHVIERFTRLDSLTLQHEATIEDPDFYTQPWTVTITTGYRPTEELFEYICQENEKDSHHNDEHLRNLGIDPDSIP